MNAQVVVGQAMQQLTTKDLAFKVLDACWTTCYHGQVTAEELSKGEIPDAKLKTMHKCQSKCLNRNMEVMRMLTTRREQRDQEQAMGLAPGSLAHDE